MTCLTETPWLSRHDQRWPGGGPVSGLTPGWLVAGNGSWGVVTALARLVPAARKEG